MRCWAGIRPRRIAQGFLVRQGRTDFVGAGDIDHGHGMGGGLDTGHVEFMNDPQTKALVVCGEIGGSDEEDAAAFIAEHLTELPVVAFIGGRNAPPGKSLGHAGAIISGNFGTPASKIAAFAAAGVPVADRPSDIPRLVAEQLAVRT